MSKYSRITRAAAVFALCAAVISAGACSRQPVDMSEKTAKASENSYASQSSKNESSVWKPSTIESEISADQSSEEQSTTTSAASDSSDTSQDPQISQASEASVTPIPGLPDEYNDGGIFSEYYIDAYRYLCTMTLDEKIGQMLMSGLPAEDEIEIARENHLGGYLMFGNDFAYQSKDQVISKISSLAISQKVPLCIAVDEEGGDVSRIGSKKELSPHEFLSPRELYKNGGMAYIQTDADEKATLLHELGIDVNLAPVCDISTNKKDFMYKRSLGEDAKTTAEFVRIVTELSQKRGVSVTLKHFPGYGSNSDTHYGSSVDTRTLEELKKNDLVPFEAGIKAGAHFVMVSHNIVNCIDEDKPASLSEKVHELLRKDMGFTGLIITDDLSMGAISKYAGGETPAVAAVMAGNDIMIITSGMIEDSLSSIRAAVQSGKISEDTINRSALRILAWKYAKGMM